MKVHSYYASHIVSYLILTKIGCAFEVLVGLYYEYCGILIQKINKIVKTYIPGYGIANICSLEVVKPWKGLGRLWS